MIKITKDSDVREIAAIVSEALEKAGINAVLSGGAAVTIYAENPYMTKDLDFVSSAPVDQIAGALTDLGFVWSKQRYFVHKETEYFVEFPKGPVAFGDKVVRESTQIETGAGTIRIITPTHCVMDRLSAYYHWNDPQCLDQAVAVAKSEEVDLDVVREWSEREGASEKFVRFQNLLQKT